MRKRINELSNEKLAMIGVFIVVSVIAIAVTLGVVAPKILLSICILLSVLAFLAAIYVFCYAIVKDFRGESW